MTDGNANLRLRQAVGHARWTKRHHLGLLALFIVLGGTSYAAARLPRNSVGTAKLRTGAVTASKLSRDVRSKLKHTGASGPAGPAGPKAATGAQGTQGPKSDTGAQGTLGILTGVAGGTSTVQIVDKTSGSPSATPNGGDVRMVAIALGG